MRAAVPAGAWPANLGATRQAVALVWVNKERYFGLSRNDNSPLTAASRGLTSLILVSRSTSPERVAHAASTRARSGNGPARSKKPGCSIACSPQGGAWHQQ